MMIGHYAIYAEPEELASQWSVKMDSQYKPTYNAQATQQLPIVTNLASDELSFFHWGVIPEMARKKAVSAKLLSLDQKELKSKSIHQTNLISHRCVIPMQGVYWSRPIGKKKSTPMYVFLDNHKLVAVAGIWSQFDDFDGNVHYIFKMLTQRADGEYREFGEELPLIIPTAKITEWLSPDQTYEQLRDIMSLPELAGMGTHAVSPKVFNATNNDASLIQVTSPSDQHGNYTLFD
ncbi:MAG: SOS response-associated peptidase family protein [Cyclobacteriaceae bacterium]